MRTFVSTVLATLPVRSASQGESFILHNYRRHSFILSFYGVFILLLLCIINKLFSIEDQINQLQQRGLLVTDIPLAEHYLSNISYYRLAGYWWPMQIDKINHVFKPESRSEDVIALYNFDRELRILVFEMIERLEIALRTRMIHYLSREFDPWWFQNTNLFINSKELARTLASLADEIERCKDISIKNHHKKYKTNLRFPPAWKTLEVTSFGKLSKLYGNLKPTVKSKDIIAEELKTINHTFLPSWLQSIAQIRNICAHHGRLWNKNLPGRPALMPNPPMAWLSVVPPEKERHMLYIHLCCMKYLLNVISPVNHFKEKLVRLFIKYPNVDLKALGFNKDWEKELLWDGERRSLTVQSSSALSSLIESSQLTM